MQTGYKKSIFIKLKQNYYSSHLINYYHPYTTSGIYNHNNQLLRIIINNINCGVNLFLFIHYILFYFILNQLLYKFFNLMKKKFIIKLKVKIK